MIGSLTLADLQATLNGQTVYKVGLDVAFEAIANTLAAHNLQTESLYTDFAERTTSEARRYGGPDSMTMEDGDETTVARAQKLTAGSNVAFPLNMAIIGIQWSEMWFRKHTVEELAAQVNGAMDADTRRIIRDIKRAIFLSSNYTSTDYLANNLDLPVKRLVNADSAAIPAGPNGETFVGSSHTHYLARVSTFASTDLDALINTVKEHYASGEIRVYINQAQETAVRGFTGFVPYTDPRVMTSVNTDRAAVGTLNLINFYNRAIGLYNGAEIFVKPWMPASYLLAFNAAAGKVACYRYDPDYGDGLQLVADDERYPWRARQWRRVFGVGVWNRVGAAVLYVGGTSYADPTIS